MMTLIAPLLLSLIWAVYPPTQKSELSGAWQTTSEGDNLTLIISDKYFSIAAYNRDKSTFTYTTGGNWKKTNDGIAVTYEYHTTIKEKVTSTEFFTTSIQGNKMMTNDISWTRIDDGSRGELEGAWLITGRKQDGKTSMRTPGARKTMKILSGTRFQWVAYNSETGEFFGTGGGSYTAKRGKYTENIEFFSKDNTRVGASLIFNYELKNGSWHHSGLSSKGDPIYELWETREALGI